jgi:hypothetical protein
MKPDYQSGNDAQLDDVLRQWTVDKPLPPRFQEEVWSRIGRAEARPHPVSSFAAWLWHFAEINVPRPKFAYSYVAVLLLLGIVGGAWAAQRESSRLDSALGSRYLQSVDPYQKVALNR